MKKEENVVTNFYKKRLISVYASALFFLAAAGVCLAFSIVSLVHSFDYVVCVILVIFSLILLFVLYFEPLNLIFYTTLYKKYKTYDFAYLVKFLKKIKPFYFIKKAKILKYLATFYLYLDDFSSYSKTINEIEKYKPQYLSSLVFIRCLAHLNNKEYKEAKSLYISLLNKNCKTKNTFYIYQLECLEALFSKIETDKVLINDGYNFFSFAPVVKRVYEESQFIGEIETDEKLIVEEDKRVLSSSERAENVLLHLFFYSLFYPFIALLVAFIVSISHLSNDPTAETRTGFLLCFFFAIIPFTVIVFTFYEKKKYPNIVFKKTAVVNLISLFFLLILGSSGFYKHYDHSLEKAISLSEKGNLDISNLTFKSAYTEKEKAIFEYTNGNINVNASKAILVFDDLNNKNVFEKINLSGNFVNRENLDTFFVDEKTDAIYPIKDKFLLPNDYNIYGVNNAYDDNVSLVSIYNLTLNTYNTSFDVENNKNYEFVIFSYYETAGWMKITNFIWSNNL